MNSPKITVKGRVVRVFEQKIEIKILNPDRCEECGLCLEDNKSLTVSVENNFNKNDNVNVEFDCNIMRRIIFWLYFVPALCLIAGFTGGYIFWGNWGGFIGGMLSLGAGYWGVKKLTSGFKNKIKVSKDEKG